MASSGGKGKNLFQKVWDAHVVRVLPNGQAQLLIGLHLIHEVTSPQAFGMLRDLKLKVAFPNRTFATVDHIIPTDTRVQPFADPLAQGMIDALKTACSEFGITYFDVASGQQGIVHVVGPEQGITQPLRFAAVLADGQQLHAFRLASDGHPPTLYLRRTASGTVIASEPLCDAESGWQLLPDGAVVSVDAGGHRIAHHESLTPA